MAVRLRPQSSAWLAPTALAAQLTAQTGAIKGSGVAGLLGGIATGVNAFSQKREQRRVEAINESRYQDSVNFRNEEMALRKQAADMETAKGQFAIVTEAKKGSDAKIALWMAENPGRMLPPELQQENDKLTAAARAMAFRMGGVQGAQAVAAKPASPVLVDGKSMSQMTDAELDDFMAKSERGEVDYTYRGGATGDMGQGVGNVPAAPRPATPTAGAPTEMPSSGDPVADKFTDAISRLSASIADMEERESEIKKRGARSAALSTQLTEARTNLLALQGRYQVYSEDRKRKMVAEETRTTQAADDARAAEARRAERMATPEEIADAEKMGAPQGLKTKAGVQGGIALGRQNDAQAGKADAAALRVEAQKARDARMQAGREAVAKILAGQRDRALAAKAVQDATENQKEAVRTAFNEYELLKKMQKDGLVSDDDPDLRSAYGKYAAERDIYAGMVGAVPEAGAAPAPVPAPAAEPMDRDTARAIFDREVRARGIDPTSDAARQLAADIKAGKVR